MAEGFAGFPSEACKFFRDLAKNNNRDWYQAHKDTYERACREPMRALMAAIDPPFGSGWMSRISNDMRFNKDRARQLRHAIAGDAPGKKLQTIIAALRRKGYTVATHESSATPPRGYGADHPRVELLKMKDIHAGRTFEPALLSSPKALAQVKKAMSDLRPFSDWLKTYVVGGR